MLKMLGEGKNNERLLTLVLEEGNFERMRDGRALLVEVGSLVPGIPFPLTLSVHWSPDLKETVKEIQSGFEVGHFKDTSKKPEGNLVCMVGLPRSGKTTLCRNNYQPRGYTIVCPDEIRRAIHGQRFISEAEPFVWATCYAMVDALLRSGNKVVIDGTHMTEKRREPWRKRGAEFVHVNTPKETCIQRATDEGDPAIVPIIERMASEFEPLTIQ